MEQPTIGEHLRDVCDFEVIREIGRGGMGIVYEARQRSLDRRVALILVAVGAAISVALFRSPLP